MNLERDGVAHDPAAFPVPSETGIRRAEGRPARASLTCGWPARSQILTGRRLPPVTPLGPGARRLLFVAWRDLANRRAGGSEVLVDRLADGMTAAAITSACSAAGPRRPLLRCGAQRGHLQPVPAGTVRTGGGFATATSWLKCATGCRFSLRLVWPSTDLPGQPHPHRFVANDVPAARSGGGPVR